MHCHKVNHVMNGNSYPGGMLSAVVYTEAMDTDIFADLIAAAGYEVDQRGDSTWTGVQFLPRDSTFTPDSRE